MNVLEHEKGSLGSSSSLPSSAVVFSIKIAKSPAASFITVTSSAAVELFP